MEDCLFCKIIEGVIPSSKVYEDEICYAFRDINPQAPTHVLLVPKKHITGMNEIDQLDEKTIAALLNTAKKIAVQEGIAESGYRVISNCGDNAGQTVHHLHFHVMGGVRMNDRMG